MRPTAARSTRPRRAVRATAASAGAVPGGGSHMKRETKRGDCVVVRGKKEDAAKRALMGALGGQNDVLAENDSGGGFGGFIGNFFGGGGGGGWWGDQFRRMGPAGSIIFLIVAWILFKPVTAILVNLVYFLLNWETDSPEPVPAAAAAGVAADADIIARYGADDD